MARQTRSGHRHEKGTRTKPPACISAQLLRVLRESPFRVSGNAAGHFGLDRKLASQVHRELEALRKQGLVRIEEHRVNGKTVGYWVLAMSGRLLPA